jgi:hypothetical protein
VRRRDFITLLGSATAAWPLAARAQQSAMPVIGFLSTGSQQSDVWRLVEFRRGLSETGYVEGRNVMSHFSWADEQYDRLPALATSWLAASRLSLSPSVAPPLRSPTSRAALGAYPAPVDNSNSGHNRRRSVVVPHAPAYCLRSSAAMACPSGRVGEQLERHVDKHRFPMRIRPGDRPPVQRSANRPLMWNCCRQLEGRSGNWAALRLSGKPWIYCCQINVVSGRSFR